MPGNLRARLADARLYLCTDARQRQGDLPEFLDAVLGAGVDIVQLRQKGLEAEDELSFLEVFRQHCDKHGTLLAVNDRADIAYAAGADVLHLGQQDLPVKTAREILGSGPIIGRSTHAEPETAAAATQEGVDYLCAGPPPPSPAAPPPAFPCFAMPRPCAPPGRGSPSAASISPLSPRSRKPAPPA
jgi:thiamine-phosphate pyrophosphorylase